MPDDSANPLLPRHQARDAELQAYGPIEIVSTFGQPQLEYAALRRGCAILDQPHRATLSISGPDRHGFVNNLVTQQVFDKSAKSGLAPGSGVYAFLLNLKGRITADVNILEIGDRLLLETDARKVADIRQHLEKHHFAEKIVLDPPDADPLHAIALHGPSARAVLERLIDQPFPALSALGSARMSIGSVPATIWRDDATGAPGYHLLVPTNSAGEVWDRLMTLADAETDPGRRRIRPIGWAAFNAARIEAGRPLFGIDFDDSVLPSETGLMDRAVSLTKGCYLGQEIVARMHARKQIPRRIVGIRMDDDALPIAGALIQDDGGSIIGAVTSSTMSPLLSDAAICIGIVKKGFFDLGTALNIPAESAMRLGRVVATPFIPPTEENHV